MVANGYVSFYSTPYQDMLDRRKKQAELDEAQERKENKVWDLDNPEIDSEGEMANAVFYSIVNEAMIDVLDDGEKERLGVLKQQLDDLKERYDNVEEPDQVSGLFDEISDLEDDNVVVMSNLPLVEEIEEIEESINPTEDEIAEMEMDIIRKSLLDGSDDM